MVVSRLKNSDVIGSEIGFHEYSKAVCVYRRGCCCGVYGCYGDPCRLFLLAFKRFIWACPIERNGTGHGMAEAWPLALAAIGP